VPPTRFSVYNTAGQTSGPPVPRHGLPIKVCLSKNMLELGKAACFFLCLASLYQAAIRAFFVPGSRWEERMLFACLHLALAGYICFMSGFVFTLPVRSNPDRGQRLTATLPVRLFFWTSACIAVLFFTSWYLADLGQQAAAYISDRALQRF
jgi:hypothetical protein